MNDVTDAKSIAVIGAGIVGVQLARALQVRGAVVTLFDPRDPGTATSFGNAGYLAVDEIFPLAHGTVLRRLPRMLLDPLGPLALRWRELHRLAPWYMRYAAACSTSRARHSIAALAAIQREAKGAWQRVIVRDGLGALVRNNGAMMIFETASGFAATRARREAQSEYGISWSALNGEQARALIPELSNGIRHAVVYPGGSHVTNPLRVTQTLFDAFVRDGGSFNRTEVDALERKGVRIDALRAGARTWRYDHVVVTAGHRAGVLLKTLRYKVPIVAERGYHVEMSHRETRLDMPVGSYERGFYITPMSSGLRLAGTTEFSAADRDSPPNWARADILKRHIAEIMPGLAEAESSRWMGHRPTLPDFLPVIGRAPDCVNLYLAFGHHHLGLTLSAVTAAAVSALIYDEHPVIDLEPYALGRFQ